MYTICNVICQSHSNTCYSILFLGYVCTENKCQCEAGFFADQEKGCLARLGDKCSLAKGPTSQLRCQDPNAFCDSRTEKCVCSEGKTCSNAITFGPTIFTTILTTITAVIAYMKM